jgi:plasmid stabilization system protein ParE
VERSRRIIGQTRRRLEGVKPDSATRLVSLHDPDARLIAKGRINLPVELGYKAQVIDNEDGIVVDYTVEEGNPADAPQLAPAIQRISKRLGTAPRAGRGQRQIRFHHTSTVALPETGTSRSRCSRRSWTCADPTHWPQWSPVDTLPDKQLHLAAILTSRQHDKAGQVNNRFRAATGSVSTHGGLL